MPYPGDDGIGEQLTCIISTLAKTMKHNVHECGFSGGADVTFDWAEMKRRRGAYIKKLNGI